MTNWTLVLVIHWSFWFGDWSFFAYFFKVAVRLMFGTAASALLTGHPTFAFPAISWNCASSILGTSASHFRSILLIVPASTVTLAEVWTRVGTNPALDSSLLKAIEKHPAWAAAMSS